MTEVLNSELIEMEKPDRVLKNGELSSINGVDQLTGTSEEEQPTKADQLQDEVTVIEVKTYKPTF